MFAGNFVNQCHQRGKRRRILGQVRARWIVDPEKVLPSVENVARLSDRILRTIQIETMPGRGDARA